ncbi:MAG: NfeD family protein [Rhodocyclaceae bacterium]|nr:MAG: NfeD family protein [Rhodocyclaceae bacterium]
MQIEWWQWAVAGIVLVLTELAVPAFVLIWFGLGALVVALIVGVLPQFSVTAQLSVWLVVSVAMVALWFKIFKPGFHKTRVGMSDANVIGEIGLLTREVAPFQNGEVRFQKPMVGSDVWPCMADEAIPTGARVKVLTVEGSFLKVGKI